MGDSHLDSQAHPLEWWPLAKASKRFGIGKKKLKRLASEREILGYPNPDFRRGGNRNPEGEWFICVKSLHEYHMRMGGFEEFEAKAAAMANSLGY